MRLICIFLLRMPTLTVNDSHECADETVQSSDDDRGTQRREAGFVVRLEECSKWTVLQQQNFCPIAFLAAARGRSTGRSRKHALSDDRLYDVRVRVQPKLDDHCGCVT